MSNLVNKPLGGIAKYINGYAFKPQDWKQTGLPIIRIENLNNSKATFNYYQDEIDDKYKVEKGDILVSWSASLDAFIWKKGTAVLNQHIFKVIPNEEVVDKDFLFYLLKKAIVDLKELVHGATMKHINRPEFEKFEVTFPESISIQKQLATKLNAQLSEVEKARESVEVQLKEVDNLANAFIYESINQQKTTEFKLVEVLEEVKNGIGENWKQYPVYGATRSGIAMAKEPPGKNPQRYKPIIPGTVFYNPMRIMIGSIAFAENDVKNGITSPDYVVLKGKDGMVDSRWFYFWLRSPLGEQCIKSLARGAVRERMLFNRLAEGTINLPDFKIQEKISLSLQNLKSLKSQFERQQKELLLLPQKILTQTFEEVTK